MMQATVCAVALVVCLLAAEAVALPRSPDAVADNTVVINVASEFGEVSFESISRATHRARGVLEKGDSCTIFFAAGHYSIEMPGALFNLTGLAAAPGKRLTIAGAGMTLTTLNVTTHGHDVLSSHSGTRRLTVTNLTWARPLLTTTQGVVISADEQSLAIKLSPGWPQLDALLVDRAPRIKPEQGLYLKRYRTGFGSDGVHIVSNSSTHSWPQAVNQQVHFSCGGSGEHCPDVVGSGGVWTLKVGKWPDGELERYRQDIHNPDALVGVKIKHGGQSFDIRNCDDISFDRVRWIGHSRGILFNCNNVALRHTAVDREPSRADAQALATPGGGPQINTCTNLSIVNHSSVGTGDDSLGLFHIRGAGSSVTGCHIRDSFARGIFLCDVPNDFAHQVIDRGGNEVIRCPIFRPDTCSYSN